jgi:hypothetical protein
MNRIAWMAALHLHLKPSYPGRTIFSVDLVAEQVNSLQAG